MKTPPAMMVAIPSGLMSDLAKGEILNFGFVKHVMFVAAKGKVCLTENMHQQSKIFDNLRIDRWTSLP